MMDQNTCFAYLNMELPDDIRRLKEAGYYDAAIARIDACLAEDWTASQNQPLHPQGALPVNPTPHGVDAWRQGLLAHREILRRLPRDYTLTAEQLLNKLQATLRDFTAEEFAALDAAGQMDWRFVEGQKRYIYRAAETLVATHPDLAARQLDPPVPERSWDRFEPQHDQMVRTGAASADITLRTSIGMTDETFARALAAAKAKGRNTVHVKVWLPLPAACPAQSNITLDSFTAQPTYIAPETAPQRTAYWEADLAENCRFGAQYSYRSTAHYAAPLEMQADPVQPDFDTAEQLPHIAFTPYMKALAAQLTEGITDPVQKAKRIYDFVTIKARKQAAAGQQVVMKPVLAILTIYVIGTVLAYSGMNPVVLMFILFPIAMDLFEKAKMSRAMGPGVVLGALATAACSMPGTTSDQNVIAVQMLGTSPMAAAVPGFIGGAVVLILNIVMMNIISKKEIAKGTGRVERTGCTGAQEAG